MFARNITPEAWTQVRGNPRQRDTERHADKIETHLQVVMPQHALVHAAQLPDGELIKLDGHTRCLLWEQNRAPVPQIIYMVITPAANMDEAMRMYSLYDNALVTELRADEVFGAFREHGLRPQSKILQRGILSGALGLAEWSRTGLIPKRTTFHVNSAIAEWKHEIASLDRIITGHESKRLHSGIVAAILLTLRQHGYIRVAPFWARYLNKDESGSVRDPHNVLLSQLRSRQSTKRTSGRENTRAIAERGLSACEHGMVNNQVKFLQGIDLLRYFNIPAAKRAAVHLAQDGADAHPAA